MKFLHLSDNNAKGQPGYYPLYKLKPPLIANFQAAYTLNWVLSIDESMVGLLPFIHYLPKKPTKWGMKAYVLVDSKTSHVYNWCLYTGKL